MATKTAIKFKKVTAKVPTKPKKVSVKKATMHKAPKSKSYKFSTKKVNTRFGRKFST